MPAVLPVPLPNESPTAEPAPTPGGETATVSEVEDEQVCDDPIGPPLDPRATDHEQWIASVRMRSNGRLIDVRMEQPAWEKLKIGDQVHVSYREGKYTGTVWSADIDSSK